VHLLKGKIKVPDSIIESHLIITLYRGDSEIALVVTSLSLLIVVSGKTKQEK
jgi:hypothetical protein